MHWSQETGSITIGGTMEIPLGHSSNKHLQTFLWKEYSHVPKTTSDISVVTNENFKYELAVHCVYEYINQRAIKNQLDRQTDTLQAEHKD